MKHTERYRDRKHAGRILAREVRLHVHAEDAIVLGLPRGGVPIAFEVAAELGAPLDMIAVRKLGVPGHPEYAMGAIASGGYEVLDELLVNELGLSPLHLAEEADRATAELHRQEQLFRGNRPPPAVQGREIVLVDDGLATGWTMRAAIVAVRAEKPKRVVVAVPVGATESCARLAEEVDELICPFQPDPFQAVGLWYVDFSATSDDEVRECLAAAAGGRLPAHVKAGRE